MDFTSWLSTRLARTFKMRRKAQKNFLRRRPAILEQLEGRTLLATLVVDDNLACPGALYPTISSAVTAASPGDTIKVCAGTYNELVNVNKTLTLNGAQAGVDATTRPFVPTNESIVNGLAGSTSFYVNASNVTIDGFAVQGATNPNQFGAGIVLSPSTSGTHIRNDIVQNNVVGLFVANNSASNQTVVEKNLFRNNTVPGPASGHDIYADEYTAGAGMQNVLIDHNKFTNTALVVNSWALGISNTSAAPFKNITFSNNEVTNHGRGMYFYNTDGATISCNTITGATNYAIGIFNNSNDSNPTDTNANFEIEHNKLTNSNRGVWVDGYSGTLEAHLNDITGNATAGIQNDDTTAAIDAEFNWWGSSTGPMHPSNPGGTGDKVVEGPGAAGTVDFTPWLVDSAFGTDNMVYTDDEGNTLVVNRQTGDYTFTDASSGTTYSGTGARDKNGKLQIHDQSSNGKIDVKGDDNTANVSLKGKGKPREYNLHATNISAVC